MQKIFIYLLVFMMSAYNSFAQRNHKYMDIYTGIGFSTLSNQSRSLQGKYSNIILPFVKGQYTEIMKSGFGYILGGGYSVKGGVYGVDKLFTNTYNIHFLDITAMTNYGLEIIPFESLSKAVIGTLGFGFNFSIPLTSSSNLKLLNPSLSAETVRNSYLFLGKNNPVGEGNIKPINTSLVFELSLRYKVAFYSMINFLLRYDMGVTNIEREKAIPMRTFTRDLYLGVGYTIILHDFLFFNK